MPLINLLRDSIRYSKNGESFLSIFFRLARLYTKSKFYKRGAVEDKIGTVVFHAHNYSSLINLYREIFLEQVYKTEISNETPFIIDCGSNIGVSVLYFHHKFSQSLIWAFEPNPASFELLEKNTSGKHIRIFRNALGLKNERILFYSPTDPASINGSFINGYSESVGIEVESLRLSDLIQDSVVDLLKIDVEGAEIAIIDDLLETNRLKQIRNIVMEFHQKLHRPGEFRRMMKAIESYGFKSEIVSEDEVQNLIILFRSGD